MPHGPLLQRTVDKSFPPPRNQLITRKKVCQELAAACESFDIERLPRGRVDGARALDDGLLKKPFSFHFSGMDKVRCGPVDRVWRERDRPAHHPWRGPCGRPPGVQTCSRQVCRTILNIVGSNTFAAKYEMRPDEPHLIFGGERGIRTLDTLLTYTHFPGVRLKPLGHLSGKARSVNNSPRMCKFAGRAGPAAPARPASCLTRPRRRPENGRAARAGR